MATTFLAPDPINSTQFIPGGNVPANGGQLFFYAAGTSTKVTVYKDNVAGTSWTNPIVLDSGGNLPNGGEVWFPQGQSMKVVFAPSTDTDPPTSPYWTKDNLSGVNDISGQSTEWITGATPTFVSGTSFQVSGDLRSTFDANRRVKYSVTAGTGYATITSSAFASGSTNVGLSTTNSFALDAGLSAVFYSILDGSNLSIPPSQGQAIFLTDPTDKSKQVTISASSVTASTSVNLNVQNSPGSIALTSEFAFSTVIGFSGRLLLPNGYIDGFQISNNATSISMDIGPGQAIDSANAFNIINTTTWTKTNAAFAAGNGNGGKMNSTAISSNAWYAFYGLLGSSGAFDVGFDLAFPPAVPTTTAAFPKFRYIGSRKTSASTTVWQAFVQHGDEVWWSGRSSSDVFQNNPGTAATTVTVNTPPQRVNAILNAMLQDVGTGRVNDMTVTDLAVGDIPAAHSSSFAQLSVIATSGTGFASAQVRAWTNTSSQVRARISASDANVNIGLATMGWVDPRGKAGY